MPQGKDRDEESLVELNRRVERSASIRRLILIIVITAVVVSAITFTLALWITTH